MTETIPATFNQETFETFVDARREPAWLVDQRHSAWKAFCEMDWPERRSEEWLRTDLRLFRLDRYSLPIEPPAVGELPMSFLAEGVELGGQVTSWNSHSIESRLDPKWKAKGVLFGSLDELVHEHGDLIRKHLLTRAIDPNYDRFSALHAACWSGGQLLYVPRGVVISEPLHAFSVLGPLGVDLGHTLVILEEGAEATFLTETGCCSPTDEGLHCGAVEVIQAPGSFLRYVQLQNWSQQVWHFAHQKALVARDASLQWTIAAMGSRLTKVNQHVGLIGTGASCQVNGVLFAEDKQHISYHTLQHHEAPHTRSDFLYKAALQDRSRTVWRGMIKVDPVAQQTDGYQRNDNLLLSAHARADSIPGLEIEADDVRCTHGSTSGKVDEELIFYARCRGFTRKEAIRIIVSGFFQQIFDRITVESVRTALGNAIGRRVREYE